MLFYTNAKHNLSSDAAQFSKRSFCDVKNSPAAFPNRLSAL